MYMLESKLAHDFANRDTAALVAVELWMTVASSRTCQTLAELRHAHFWRWVRRPKHSGELTLVVVEEMR